MAGLRIIKSQERLPSVGPSLAGLAIAPDGRWLWLASGTDPSRPAHALISEPGKLVVTLWDLAANRALGSLETQPVASPSLVAAGTTRRVLVAHSDGGWLLDLDTRRETPFPQLKRDLLYGPPHINDEGTLATAYVSEDATSRVQRIDLSTGRVVLDLEGAQAPFALSRDDRRLCHVVESGSGLVLRIVRTADGATEYERCVSASQVLTKALALDEAGRTVAWIEEEKIGVWHVGSEPRIHRILSFATETPLLAFAPDGKTVFGLTRGSLSLIHTIDAEAAGASGEDAAGGDGFGGLFDGDLGEEDLEKNNLGYVTQAAITAAGTAAFVATDEGLAQYTLTQTGATRGAVVAPPSIDCVAVLPALGWVVTASRHAPEITFRKPGQEAPVQVVDAACEGVRELHPAPDGASLYIVGMDGSISHFAPAREPPLVRWACPFVYSSYLTIEPGGKRAVCSHGLIDGQRGRNHSRGLPPEKQDGYTLWDLESGCLLAEHRDIPGPAQSLVWIPGVLDAVCIRSGYLAFTYDMVTGESLGSDSFPLDWIPSSPDPQVLPGGERVLTLEEERLIVWDLRAESVAADLCEAERTRVLAIDATGRRIVLADQDGGAAIYSLVHDRCKELDLRPVLDGEPAAAAAWGTDGTLALITLSQRIVVVVA